MEEKDKLTLKQKIQLQKKKIRLEKIETRNKERVEYAEEKRVKKQERKDSGVTYWESFRKKLVEFLFNMNRELRRVKWHVGKPLVKDFVVVIIFGLILAAILYGVDCWRFCSFAQLNPFCKIIAQNYILKLLIVSVN